MTASGDLVHDLVRSSMRSRQHPHRPSFERAWFTHGGKRLPDGRMWAMIAAFDDEGPAADVAVDPFPISGVRRAGTRGVTQGEANHDRRDGVRLFSWLTAPSVAEVVLDTSAGPWPAMLWGDLARLEVRLFLVLIDDPATTVVGARHLDDDGGTLAVEELDWTEDLGWTDGAVAGSAAEIAEVLADQDRVDAGRGAVFRIDLAEPDS